MANSICYQYGNNTLLLFMTICYSEKPRLRLGVYVHQYCSDQAEGMARGRISKEGVFQGPHMGHARSLNKETFQGRSCFAALGVYKLQVQFLVLDLIPVTSLVTESHLLPAAEEGGTGTLWLECTLGH